MERGTVGVEQPGDSQDDGLVHQTYLSEGEDIVQNVCWSLGGLGQGTPRATSNCLLLVLYLLRRRQRKGRRQKGE